jgi:hypothetical protein
MTRTSRRRERARIAGSPSPAPRTEAPASRWTSLLWYAAAGAIVWSFGYHVSAGIDLWWHLAAGPLLARRGPFGLTDPWSFTRAGAPWLHHEWLADLVFHEWTRWFGLTALVYWKWGMLIVTFLLFLRLLRSLTGAPVSSAIALLFAAAVAGASADIRPHLYTSLGYVVVLSLTLGRRRPPLWLPLVFVLWSNLHSGVVFGLMALAVILAANLLASPGGTEQRARPALLWLACAAACLLNPRGADTLTYPFRYAMRSDSPFRTHIQEWLPLFAPGVAPMRFAIPAIGVALAAAVVLLIGGAGRERPALLGAGLGLTVLTLAMTLSSRRFLPLLAVSEALLVAPALSRVLEWWRRGAESRSPGLMGIIRRRGELAAAALALIVGLVRLAPYPHTGAAFVPLTDADTFPVEVCNFIDTNGLAGNVLVEYTWGGYLDLRTNGRMKVFVDSRADTVFDEGTYGRYWRVSRLEAGWEGVLQDPAIQFVLFRRASSLAAELQRKPEWKLISEDLVAQLFVRVGPGAPVLPDPLRPTAMSGYRELAQGATAMLGNAPRRAASHFRRALQLDPRLYIACRNLVVAELGCGEPDRAAQTAERCQAIFPDRKLLSLAQSVTPGSDDGIP